VKGFAKLADKLACQVRPRMVRENRDTPVDASEVVFNHDRCHRAGLDRADPGHHSAFWLVLLPHLTHGSQTAAVLYQVKPPQSSYYEWWEKN